MRVPWRYAIAAALAAAGLCGCNAGKELSAYSLAGGQSARLGKQVIVKYRCGSCHMIPGVPGARGTFGPPLNKMALRTYVAGEFPNDPQNLVHWIQAPTLMKPKTTMPDLGLSQGEAVDAAAYLDSLR